MANMSYCRFENTYNDLIDCLRATREGEELSEREEEYRKRLLVVCEKMLCESDEEE